MAVAVTEEAEAEAAGRASILPLALEGLCFEVAGQQLLRDVAVRIEAGPPTLLLGPNGAGKSLTLRIAHGLLKPTRGHVRWCGIANRGGPADAGAVRRCQTMVFERPAHLRRSAAANVEYPLALRGVGRAERRARAREVLAKSGLSSLADRSARVLSAGEQQRLALARAWVIDPDVLFLDEPTAALDPSATRAVEALIQEISDSGAKIIMTTHDLGQARRLAGDILFLCAGAVVERAPAERFFESPATDAARAFLRGDLVW